MLVAQLFEALISARRIEKFFFAEEIDLGYMNRSDLQDETNKYSVQMENGNFYWKVEEEPTNQTKDLRKVADQVNINVKSLIEEASLDQNSVVISSNKIQQKTPLILQNLSFNFQKNNLIAIIGE